MGIELTRIAHFSGEGLPAATEVMRATLDDANDVYFLTPRDRSGPPQVSTVALTVEKLDSDGRKFADNPQVEIAFEARDVIRPEHMAMLAHAALSESAYVDVLLRGMDDDRAEMYRETLGLREEFLTAREDDERAEPGYIGSSSIVAGFAAHTLRMAAIGRARYLPAEELENS